MTERFEGTQLAAEMEAGCSMAGLPGSDRGRELAAKVYNGELTLEEARADIVSRIASA